MKALKPGNQNYRGLLAFLSGAHLHRFDAEKIGIHALHSVISNFERMGLRFDRATVSVPTKWGANAHVTRYWLAPESYATAARLLGMAPPQNPPETDSANAYRRASGG